MKKSFIKVLIGVVFLITTFFISPPQVKAYINPNTYKIIIVGDGTTTSKTVTIKAQRQLLDDWVCFGTVSGSSEISFNNTGNKNYLDVGTGNCSGGWNTIQWDITGYDGNVTYGLKTIGIKLWYSNEVYDYTTRSVVYEKEPDPTPPPPADPTPQPEIKSTPTKTITNAAPTTTTNEAPKIAENITPAPQPETTKAIEGISTSKNNKYYYFLIIPVFALIIGSYFFGKKRSIK